MLDKNDIQVLKGMFLENNVILKRDILGEVGTELDGMREEIGGLRKEVSSMREDMHTLIAASERRITQSLTAKMDRLRVEITTDVAELLDEHILSQIADLQRDMTKVKRHLKLA